MTAWRQVGKKSVKGKNKGKQPFESGKKALNPLGYKAFALAGANTLDALF